MKGKGVFLLMVALLFSATQATAASPSCTVQAKIAPENQTVDELTNGSPTLVKLNGEPSKDENTYSWIQIDGPPVKLSNPSIAQPTFYAPSVGSSGATLTFQLTVTGCNPVQSDTITTIINVTNVETNLPPVASATVSPNPVNEGGVVTLDGSSSGDPNGDTITFKWEQLTGTPVTLNYSSDAIATFTAPNDAYPNGEPLTFRLTVSDGYLTNYTDKIVNIVWVNDPPVAVVTCPETVDEGASVTLEGTGSSDSDDGIASYAWTQLEGLPNADLTGVDLSSPNISFAAPQLTSLLNTMKFKLIVSDKGGLSSSAECSVTVLDVTPPTINCIVPDQEVWYGADVTVNCTASDSGSGLANSADASFTLTTSVVAWTETASATTGSKTVADNKGNSATVGPYTFKVDKKPPTVSCGTADANWHATEQTVTCTATDGGSGPASQTITLSTTVPNDTETANASTNTESVCDAVNNCSNAGPVTGFKIDKKAPTNITFVGGPADGGSYYFGFVPAAPTCTATDAGSGLAGCTVTGYATSVGVQTLTATATDNVGNSNTATRSYTVLAWTLKGFYQPVDMPGSSLVYNSAKNGSTVPLKFEIFAGPTELTNTSYIKSLTYAQTSCSETAITDDLETTATGGTVLRYDSMDGQFIYNWKTPNTAGKCYRVTMTTLDSSSLVAYFKLK